jgi:hypothetical protein
MWKHSAWLRSSLLSSVGYAPVLCIYRTRTEQVGRIRKLLRYSVDFGSIPTRSCKKIPLLASPCFSVCPQITIREEVIEVP